MGVRAFFKWIIKGFKQEYTGNLLGDLSGGVTTAVVALPLALAFAIASGVPAKYGLYTAIVTGIVAAVFGGSKIQVTGPTGGMAAVLITVTTIYGYEKVVLISIIAGILQIIAGGLKLGRFVRMLPFPLVAGFTMGIGIIIFGGQIDNALGLSIHHTQTEFYDRFIETFHHMRSYGIHSASLAIAGLVIVSMITLGKVAPRIPAAMISILIASVVCKVFDLQLAYIKEIPRTLPSPHFPLFSWDMFRELLRPAATIAALGAIESLLAAVVADNILADGTKHQSNRELFGQGMANISAGLFGGIPCTGAIARTAVNIKSGGRTRLSAILHSVTLILVLLFFAPLATCIPIAALAGVLMVTSVRMVEWREIRWLMTAPRSDIAVMAVTVGVTVFTDLVMAVEFGLITAGLLFVSRMSQTQLVPIESAAEHKTSGARTIDHHKIRIFRLPGPLFWGDSHAVIEALEQCEDAAVVILKMHLVHMIDATGVAALREVKHALDRKRIRFLISGVPASTLQTLKRMGITSEIGENAIFSSIEAALEAGHQIVRDSESSKKEKAGTVLHA